MLEARWESRVWLDSIKVNNEWERARTSLHLEQLILRGPTLLKKHPSPAPPLSLRSEEEEHLHWWRTSCSPDPISLQGFLCSLPFSKENSYFIIKTAERNPANRRILLAHTEKELMRSNTTLILNYCNSFTSPGRAGPPPLCERSCMHTKSINSSP